MTDGKPQKFVALIQVSASLGDWRPKDLLREMWEDSALRAGAISIPADQELTVEDEPRWLEDGTRVDFLRVTGLAVPPNDA